MRYQAHLVASNDFEDLENQLNSWLDRVRPGRIHTIAFTADGLEFTYCVLVLFVAKPNRLGDG